MPHRRDIENAVGRSGRGADGIAQFDRAQYALLPCERKNVKRSAACSKINLAVGHERRRPCLAANLMRPERLPGLCIETMKLSPAICDEDEPVAQRHGRHDMLFERIRPELRRACDIATLRGIDAF